MLEFRGCRCWLRSDQCSFIRPFHRPAIYTVSQKECTNRMLLEPWCTGFYYFCISSSTDCPASGPFVLISEHTSKWSVVFPSPLQDSRAAELARVCRMLSARRFRIFNKHPIKHGLIDRRTNYLNLTLVPRIPKVKLYFAWLHSANSINRLPWQRHLVPEWHIFCPEH